MRLRYILWTFLFCKNWLQPREPLNAVDHRHARGRREVLDPAERQLGSGQVPANPDLDGAAAAWISVKRTLKPRPAEHAVYAEWLRKSGRTT